jgi:hypothetical protein
MRFAFLPYGVLQEIFIFGGGPKGAMNVYREKANLPKSNTVHLRGSKELVSGAYHTST